MTSNIEECYDKEVIVYKALRIVPDGRGSSICVSHCEEGEGI